MKRVRLAIAAAFVLGAVIAFSLGLHYGGTGRLIQVETAPNGQERLEFYRPGLLQQRLGFDDGDYAVVRLSRTADGTTIATSAPFFYDGIGPTHWSSDAIDVGTGARFERATGRWSIQ